MKQKILIVLMALVLPVMVSCGGDNDDETPTVSFFDTDIYGYWTCMSYQEDGVDMTNVGYYIRFDGSGYSTNMPCFTFGSGNFSYRFSHLTLIGDMSSYAVNLKENCLTIKGRTPAGKSFLADFIK